MYAVFNLPWLSLPSDLIEFDSLLTPSDLLSVHLQFLKWLYIAHQKVIEWDGANPLMILEAPYLGIPN